MRSSCCEAFGLRGEIREVVGQNSHTPWLSGRKSRLRLSFIRLGLSTATATTQATSNVEGGYGRCMWIAARLSHTLTGFQELCRRGKMGAVDYSSR